MIATTTQPIFGPCPLCLLDDFIEFNDTIEVPNMILVRASIYCTDCDITVSGETLEQAIEKWNKLSGFKK